MAIKWFGTLTAVTALSLLTATSSVAAQAEPDLAITEQAEPDLAVTEQAEPGLAAAQQTEPDVVLDVPNLTVQELNLDVENLRAHVSLDTRLATLLNLSAGVDLSTDKITLSITGVQAELHLRVRLDNVAKIVDRTLTTLDHNPQLLQGLLSTTSGLLSQSVNTLGQTVIRTVDSTGNIVERTIDSNGNVISQTVTGNVSNLPVVSETKNPAGQTVRQVRDTSGAVIEVVLDAAGKVLSTRVISQAAPG